MTDRFTSVCIVMRTEQLITYRRDFEHDDAFRESCGHRLRDVLAMNTLSHMISEYVYQHNIIFPRYIVKKSAMYNDHCPCFMFVIFSNYFPDATSGFDAKTRKRSVALGS